MKLSVVRAFLAAAALVTLGGAAHAQDVTVSFKGTITQVDNSPFSVSILVGQPFTGYYTYNLATPSTSYPGIPEVAYYHHLGEPVRSHGDDRQPDVQDESGKRRRCVSRRQLRLFRPRLVRVLQPPPSGCRRHPCRLDLLAAERLHPDGVDEAALPSTAPTLSQWGEKEVSIWNDHPGFPFYTHRGQFQEMQLGMGLYVPPAVETEDSGTSGTAG